MRRPSCRVSARPAFDGYSPNLFRLRRLVAFGHTSRLSDAGKLISVKIISRTGASAGIDFGIPVDFVRIAGRSSRHSPLPHRCEPRFSMSLAGRSVRSAPLELRSKTEPSDLLTSIAGVGQPSGLGHAFLPVQLVPLRPNPAAGPSELRAGLTTRRSMGLRTQRRPRGFPGTGNGLGGEPPGCSVGSDRTAGKGE